MQANASANDDHTTGIFKSILTSKKKGLSRKLLIIVLLISSVLTFAQFSYQLYSEYLIGLEEVNYEFEQIFLNFEDSAAKSVINADIEETNIFATGILALPNIEQVTISETSGVRNKQLANLSTTVTSYWSTQKVQLDITEIDTEIVIGKTEVRIGLAPLYNDLYDKLLFIFLLQAIKVFSVSILIFGAFHFIVTQHLAAMAKFYKTPSEENLDDTLTLQRNKPDEDDELDTLVTAINASKMSIKVMIESNQHSTDLKTALEKKNIELEKIHSELKETQEKLLGSEKMAVLGNMVKGVAHELNTPIGVSITGVSHLQSETDKLISSFGKGDMTKSALTDYLGDSSDLSRSINVSLRKAAQLIQSFKLVSVEQHEDTVSEFNVYHNFEDIVNSLRPSFKNNNIEIINEVPADVILNSFPGIFYQIYTNLLNNAALHAFEGVDQGVILLSGSFSDNQLTLKFSDNGRGMNAHIKKQLFEAFFTTKRGSGGTGLGMNIVYTLITEKLGGKVDVESEEGKGTTFIISVPSFPYT